MTSDMLLFAYYFCLFVCLVSFCFVVFCLFVVSFFGCLVGLLAVVVVPPQLMPG